ncbi:MAG: APC family permease [Lachnospiraceae bacterium]|nr:APC family permease [Lachnospiraceae bacterium]
MEEKKIGLPSAIATGVGLIVATSCLMSLGQGAGSIGITFIIAMVIACVFNLITALSLAELNALMPNLTGGLAQYTLAALGPFVSVIAMVGGYLVCNTICGAVECAMFGNTMNSVFKTGLPSSVFCVILLVVLIIANLYGIDMFAKIQDFVAYGLIFSLVIMGLIGMFKAGTGTVVNQPYVLSSSPKDIMSLVGLAFFLFLGCEFIIPIAPNVKNARRNVPLGMVLSLLIVCGMEVLVILGMHNYTKWDELASNTSPHVFYGVSLLGKAGEYWMAIVSIFAVVSTVNSVISSLSYICAGMAKINLLPAVFEKRNKHGAPYVGILMIGGLMIIINATGLSTTSQLSTMILIGCVFWMAAYAIASVDVLIFRKRLPKAPRTFKVPGGPVLPILGIAGNIFMMYNITADPDARRMIYIVVLIIFAALAVYATIWIKKVMQIPLFKPIPVHKVMAMENDMYMVVRRKMRAGETKKVTAEGSAS